MQVRSLGWEDPLEEGMATHSSVLAWRIPWTEEPGSLTVHGVAKSWMRLNTSTYNLFLKIVLSLREFLWKFVLVPQFSK